MQPPDMSIWSGRDDTPAEGPSALRWHQCVKPFDARSSPGIALIGFACDEGVRRNQGRVGAGGGPMALRHVLAKLAWNQTTPIHDVGDVICADGDMESAQVRLAETVEAALRKNCVPFVLGGGHETAWGTFQGLAKAKPTGAIGIVNIDAHFDLRTARQANSGTPFRQMAEWCLANGRPFRYLCLGICEAANTAALFDKAKSLGVEWIPDTALRGEPSEAIRTVIDSFVGSVDFVYLSVDLDVLPAAVMPAVSAPAIRGVALPIVESLIEIVQSTKPLAAADIVEFNPQYDPDGRAARVAAGLIWQMTKNHRG